MKAAIALLSVLCVIAGGWAVSSLGAEKVPCIRRGGSLYLIEGDTAIVSVGREVEALLAPEAECRPADIEVVEWESSDQAVASISGTGVISANRPGVAVVSARTGGALVRTRIQVIPHATLQILPSHQQANVGDTVRFSIVALDRNGSPLPGLHLPVYTNQFEVARAIPPFGESSVNIIAVRPGTVSISSSSIFHQNPTATLTVLP